VDGAVPVVLAAVLHCAWHLDLIAEEADGGLIPKRAELAEDAVSEEVLKAIDEVRWDPLTDSKSLQVRATPRSAFAHQALVDWSHALQGRLDECWAVVGDVFGDARFGFRLRSASTPLAGSSRAQNGASLPYVPKLARLTNATTQLIRLLTAPLYGDRPEVGVRELVQNALDAVRERQHWPTIAPRS
jgi:molecular chaperone HtpG